MVYFDIAQALADPHHLDTGDALPHSFNPGMAEQSSACWLDDDCIAVATSAEPEQNDVEDDGGLRLRPRGLAVYDVTKRSCVAASSSTSRLEQCWRWENATCFSL